MLQTQTAVERFDEALYELEREVQTEIQRQAKSGTTGSEQSRECNQHCNHHQPSYINTCCESGTACDSRSATETVVEVDVASIYSKTSSSVYLETEESVDQFVDALKAELKNCGDKKACAYSLTWVRDIGISNHQVLNEYQ